MFEFFEGFGFEDVGGFGGGDEFKRVTLFIFFEGEFFGFEFDGAEEVVGGGEFIDDGDEGVELADIDVVILEEEVLDGGPGEGDGIFGFDVAGVGDFEDLVVGIFGIADFLEIKILDIGWRVHGGCRY